jgi:hypothetical protein
MDAPESALAVIRIDFRLDSVVPSILVLLIEVNSVELIIAKDTREGLAVVCGEPPGTALFILVWESGWRSVGIVSCLASWIVAR